VSLQELQLTVLYLQKIAASLEVISSIKVRFAVNSTNNIHNHSIFIKGREYANKGLVVDDVLNSGTNNICSKAFIDVPQKNLKQQCLVDQKS
jgi:hypothetical protein